MEICAACELRGVGTVRDNVAIAKHDPLSRVRGQVLPRLQLSLGSLDIDRHLQPPSLARDLFGSLYPGQSTVNPTAS
jgi:hypothetical protein